MCYILNEDECTPLVAKKDIQVFKIGYLRNNRFLSSPRNTVYEFEEEKQVLEFWTSFDITVFDETITRDGLYSLGSEDAAKHYFKNLLRNGFTIERFRARIFKATIPKGSHYLKTRSNYIISDRLIVHKEILEWYPELGKKWLRDNKEIVESFLPEEVLLEI